MTKPSRDISKLNPDFLRKVKPFLAECPQIFVTEAVRSRTRQNELLASGASKINISLHQYGRAIDIGFYGKELYPKSLVKWREVADVAKKYGINWGYDLWAKSGFIDKPHFQDNFKPFIMDVITEILALFKELYPTQEAGGKRKIAAIGKKIRILQAALGIPVTK